MPRSGRRSRQAFVFDGQPVIVWARHGGWIVEAVLTPPAQQWMAAILLWQRHPAAVGDGFEQPHHDLHHVETHRSVALVFAALVEGADVVVDVPMLLHVMTALTVEALGEHGSRCCHSCESGT